MASPLILTSPGVPESMASSGDVMSVWYSRPFLTRGCLSGRRLPLARRSILFLGAAPTHRHHHRPPTHTADAARGYQTFGVPDSGAAGGRSSGGGAGTAGG